MDFNRELLRAFDAAGEAVERRIEEGIEQHRKGTARLTVCDAAGKPLPGVRVGLRQTRHAFGHGANLFLLDELETPAKNEAYQSAFASAFNLATLPFYWSDLEPVQGQPRFAADSPRIYRRPPPDLCLEYCEANGIRPKAHCLTYHSPFATPAWVPDDIEATKRLLEARYRSIAERYAGRIRDWEVTNETLSGWHNTAFFGMRELVEWNFALAARYFPENHLIINEASEASWEFYQYDRSQYYLLAERALSKGARIDAIGMQYHLFFPRETLPEKVPGYLDPHRLFAVLDTYAALGRPIQITEITIPAYSADAADEALQAELIERLYRVWFSHPAVEAIIYWNLTDGYAAFAAPGDMSAGENRYYAGLLRHDLSEKPAFQTLRRLFQETWHTDVTLTTDAAGQAEFRGFYGDYAAELTLPGASTATLSLHHQPGGATEHRLQFEP